MNKDKKLFPIYYYISQLTVAIAVVQRIPYLVSLGYSPNQRAVILSALALFGILCQLMFGYLSDKSKNIKKYAMIAIFAFSIFSFFTYSVDVQFFIYHLVFVVLSGSMQTVFNDLNDSWIMQSDPEVAKNFSFIKGFQSFGYATGALVGSTIINAFGYKSFSGIILFMGIILLFISFKISAPEQTKDRIPLRFKDLTVLLKSADYRLSLIVFISYFTITQIHAISIADKLLYLGGNELHVALRVLVAVGLEGFGYIICNKLYKSWGPYKLLSVASIGYMIMYFLFVISKTPAQMVTVAALQIITVPFYIVSMRNVVFDISPANLKASGPLFMGAIFTGVSGTLTPIVVGLLVTFFGINAPLFLAIALAFFTLLMIPILKNQIEGSKEH